jgi:hypothetical protein
MDKYKYFFISLACILLISCSDDRPVKKAVTFMIYMAADNSLSSYAVSDIDEMERSVFDPAQANVIVQADFSLFANDPGSRRWEIIPDGLWDFEVSSPIIENLGEIDSGDWRSLVAFYNWCAAAYPADRFVLSIWSHGNNWYSYPSNPNVFCPDSDSGNNFDIPAGDLQNAFAEFKFKPDLVILDACHMQSIEVISEIYPYCNYICGSPDIIPFSGFPYTEVITEVCDNDKYDYCNLPGLFVASYEPGGSQNLTGSINPRVSASLINSTTFSDEIIPVIQDMISYTELDKQMRDEIITAADNCYKFNDLDIDIDLIDFFVRISENTTNEGLAEITGKIQPQIISANSFYNYPAANIGNLTITITSQDTFHSWLNLRSEYHQLNFDELTNWYNFIYGCFDLDRELSVTLP